MGCWATQTHRQEGKRWEIGTVLVQQRLITACKSVLHLQNQYIKNQYTHTHTHTLSFFYIGRCLVVLSSYFPSRYLMWLVSCVLLNEDAVKRSNRRLSEAQLRKLTTAAFCLRCLSGALVWCMLAYWHGFTGAPNMYRVTIVMPALFISMSG